MKQRLQSFKLNEQGGIHILVLGLLAIITLTVIGLASVNWGIHTLSMNKAKPLLDQSTRAAALNIDSSAAVLGLINWNEAKARNDFYRYLQLNFRLDDNNQPLGHSFIATEPVVHVLEFVTAAQYPHALHQSISLYPGGTDATIRMVDVTLYGPSVLAIVEFRIRRLGSSQLEPLVISSVSSVRFR
ncbi:MAG: hypothetical protein K6T85_08095 [Gorillibacterium sp.]|nr:hypothetical protein [Gorillibacterium sp.]